MPNSSEELSREIRKASGLLMESGADLMEATRAVEDLIPIVQAANHPDRDKIEAVLYGVIEHLDRKVISSAQVLLGLAARMAA
jgi:hypothetical protein